MIYCINPWCLEPQNPDHPEVEHCLSCGTALLINEQYRLLSPLHHCPAEPDPEKPDREVLWVDCGGRSKVLKTLTENSSISPEVEQFRQEADVLQRLKHKGIPDFEDYFIFEDCNIGPPKLHCLVMEKIEGENLEQWAANKSPISQDLALQWLRELTKILHYVHQEGFFHGDIKPSNIMLRISPCQGETREGELVLIDFGAVREIKRTYLEKTDWGLDATGVSSFGSYTSPEQICGCAVPQSDFFSLGRTFVYLLTGKPLAEFANFETGKLIEWRDSVPGLSTSLADLIDELMAPAPEKRPRTTGEILQRLEKIDLSATPEPKKRGFVNRRAIASACLLLGIIGFWSSLPAVANFLNLRGLEYKRAGQLYKAHLYYNWAIRLQPERATAHYNLGSLYEDWHQLDNARREYIIAAQQNLPDAINNLARLDIRAGNYEVAVNRLLEGLKQAKNDFVISTLYKNLGWARVKQGRYSDAEADLQMAIALDEAKASAHCLLAQALDGQKKVKAAQQSWENCLRYASSYNPDEDSWINSAQQRLAGEDKL